MMDDGETSLNPSIVIGEIWIILRLTEKV